MKQEIKSEKLIKILKMRGVAVNAGRKLQEEIETLQKKQQKEGYKLDRLKDKTTSIIKPIEDELAEFEYIEKVYLEDDKAYMTIEDKIEKYKELVREKKDEKK